MTKYTYTDEQVDRLKEVMSDGVTEEKISETCNEFDVPRRSLTAKLRKLGYEVPTIQKAPAFSDAETEELREFLENNSGVYTSDEVAKKLSEQFGRTVTSRQIAGKVLSMELTDAVKKTEKKEKPKTYTDEEEALVVSMCNDGSFIEDIAEALNKEVNSIRGKLLSLKLVAKQRDKKEVKKSKYDGIDEVAADMTVAELVEHFGGEEAGVTERGIKTVLTRRKLSCKDRAFKEKS